MKRCGDGDLFELRRTIWRKSQAEIHYAIGVVPVRSEIPAQLRGMALQYRVENRDVLDQLHYTLAGRRLLIQALMSAMTSSLPMSLRRSWKWPSYSFSVLSVEAAVS